MVESITGASYAVKQCNDSCPSLHARSALLGVHDSPRLDKLYRRDALKRFRDDERREYDDLDTDRNQERA